MCSQVIDRSERSRVVFWCSRGTPTSKVLRHVVQFVCLLGFFFGGGGSAGLPPILLLYGQESVTTTVDNAI